MLPAVLAASILFGATLGFGAFHTWPFGFWYWTFNLVWKRYYGIEAYWPEEEDLSNSSRPVSRRLRTRIIEISWFSIFQLLPLLFAVDGILKVNLIFYSAKLSFFSPYDTCLQILGAITLAACLILLTWADSFLSRYLYGIPHQERRLLTVGPYRYVRHPVYISFILFGMGTLLLSLNYLVIVPTTLRFYLAYTYQSVEERELLHRYGKEYEQYKRTTGGFFPKIFNRHG